MISSRLHTLHSHAALVAQGTPVRALLAAAVSPPDDQPASATPEAAWAASEQSAQVGADVCAELHELPTEVKEGLISWAHAHGVRCATCPHARLLAYQTASLCLPACPPAWLHPHVQVLLQIFGPREPLAKLMKAPPNRPHFARLAALASLVYDLGSSSGVELDEDYFTPLRDVINLQRTLHVEAPLARAVHDCLLVFSMAKRRAPPSRASRRAKA